MEQIDRIASKRPELAVANISSEIAERTRAITTGGIGAVYMLVKRLGLDRAINNRLGLLKVHLLYHESDHALNIAYNLLAGGTRLEHLEFLRNDEGYLDALGARRIPDPTTAGVKFVFGLQAAPDLYEYVENLSLNTWKELIRPAKHRVKTEPRRRPVNVKQRVVEDREFKDIRLSREYVADFRYQPLKCEREYRIVVLWKDLEVHEGQ